MALKAITPESSRAPSRSPPETPPSPRIALQDRLAELEEKRAQDAAELRAWRAEEGGFTSVSRMARAAGELLHGEHRLQRFVRAAGEPEATGPSPLRLRLQELQERIDLTGAAAQRVARGEAPLEPHDVGADLVLDEIAVAMERPLTREDLVVHRAAFLRRAIERGDAQTALETYAALGALYLEAPGPAGESVHQAGGRPSLTSLVNGWILTGRLRSRGTLVLTGDDLEQQQRRILKLARRLRREGALPADAPEVTAESVAREADRLRDLERSPAHRRLLETGVAEGHRALRRSTEGKRLSRFGRRVVEMLDEPSTWAMVIIGGLAGHFGRLSMAAARSAPVGARQIAAARETRELAGVTVRRFLGTRAAEGVGFHLGVNAFEQLRGKGHRATWGLGDFARSVALFEVLGAVHLRGELHHIENKVLHHAAALGEETLGLSLVGLGECWLRGGDGQDALDLLEGNLQFLLAMRLLSAARFVKGGFRSAASQRISAKRAEFVREFRRARQEGLPRVEQEAAVQRGCRAYLEHARAVGEEISALRRDRSILPEGGARSTGPGGDREVAPAAALDPGGDVELGGGLWGWVKRQLGWRSAEEPDAVERDAVEPEVVEPDAAEHDSIAATERASQQDTAAARAPAAGSDAELAPAASPHRPRSDWRQLEPCEHAARDAFREAYNARDVDRAGYVMWRSDRGEFTMGRVVSIEEGSVTIDVIADGRPRQRVLRGEELLSVEISDPARRTALEFESQPESFRPHVITRACIDLEGLAGALERLLTEADASPYGLASAEAQREVRELTRELVFAYGLKTGDAGKLPEGIRPHQREALERRTMGDVFTVYDLPHALGEHSWEGEVTVRRGLVASAIDALRWLADPGAPEPEQLEHKLEALKIIIHEELHGCSELSSGAYQKQGKTLEEVTTEVACRALLRNEIRHRGGAPGRFATLELPEPDGELAGSYAEKIQSVLIAMKDGIGWSWPQCCAALEEVSLEVKRRGVPFSPNEHALLDRFVDRIPRVPGWLKTRVAENIFPRYRR